MPRRTANEPVRPLEGTRRLEGRRLKRSSTIRAKPKRIMAVWLPWWPAERLARRLPEARTPVLAAVRALRGRAIVDSVNLRAAHAGLHPGMPRADARAIVPDLVTCPADPANDARTLESLARWAQRFTPRTAVGEQECIFLDIGGCAHLFGGERGLADSLRRGLDRLGLTSRIALAGTLGAAWALARYSKEEPAIVPASANPAQMKEALADLPVAALRIDSEVAKSLASFGLDRVRTLFDIASVKLRERFGPAVSLRLDQAVGALPEPLVPLRPPLPREVRRAFAEPVSAPDDLRAVLSCLLAARYALLRRTEEGARRLRLVCYRVDGEPEAIVVGTSRPMRQRKPLLALFADKLDRLDPGFGIEEAVLSAEVAEATGDLQTSCWTDGAVAEGTDTPGDSANDKLSGLLDRLGNRFGFQCIARPVPRHSWLPEEAVGHAASLLPFPQSSVAGASGSAGAGASTGAADGWPAGRRRPSRLFTPPKPVKVSPSPEDAPPHEPPSAFRFRGKLHHVRSAAGPERIDCEWWRAAAPARYYYLAEDERGQRWWLYREEGSGDRSGTGTQPGGEPRWFLHGVFG